jgi:hypothetical protein
MENEQHVFFSKKYLADQNKFDVRSCFENLKFFFIKQNFVTDVQFFVKKHYFSNLVNEIVFHGSMH